MKKTVTQLADGRELIYFDRDDGADRTASDLRPLAAPGYGPHMRRDDFTGDWVAISSQRNARTFLPGAGACPLCPSRPGAPTEIPAADYDVAVFENRFPAFSGRPADLPGTVPAHGRCEVVCFSPAHDASFASLEPQQAQLVMTAWIDRAAELGALPGIEQVFCFENRGVEIGVTIHHPHGQIYAYPYVTPYTSRVIERLRRRPRMFADAIAEAVNGTIRGTADRVVAANEEWVAFVPYAARWPFEVLIFPRRRAADLPGLDPAARDGFVPIYLDVLGRFDRLFDSPAPYVSGWNQAPARIGWEHWWLFLRIFSNRRAPGRLKYLAGSEAAMGAFVNDVHPEQAAAMLRAA